MITYYVLLGSVITYYVLLGAQYEPTKRATKARSQNLPYIPVSRCVRVLPVPATDSRARDRRGAYALAAVHGPTHAQPTMDKIEYKRLEYKHEGRTIYEWHQSLEEVHA